MKLTTCRPKAASFWDEFFEEFNTPTVNSDISPRANVVDNGKTISVDLELPGVAKEDIKIELEGGVLRISAEKKSPKHEERNKTYFNEISYGSYKRSFRLSDEIEADKVEAKYENGVLKLELSKKEKALPKNIDVK